MFKATDDLKGLPMNDWTEYLTFLVALVSIANPIGAIPVFITLTSDETLSQRRRIASQTTLAFSCILLVILFVFIVRFILAYNSRY